MPTQRGYRFEGNAAIGGLFEGVVLNQLNAQKNGVSQHSKLEPDNGLPRIGLWVLTMRLQ